MVIFSKITSKLPHAVAVDVEGQEGGGDHRDGDVVVHMQERELPPPLPQDEEKGVQQLKVPMPREKRKETREAGGRGG